jgi:cytohesin
VAGFAALHAAAATGQMAIAAALLKHGADPNARVTMPLRLSAAVIPYNPELVTGRLSQVGATPFMIAAKAVNARMMRLLLDNGADPLKRADDGTTALILAAGLGKRSTTDMFAFIRYYTWDEARAIETIKLCLELGIDINAANEFGETALHGATYHAAHEVIQFLVSKGANINAENWSGQTPLRLAQGHFYSGTFVRYAETAELLRKLGADPAAGVQLNFGITQYAGDKTAGTSEPK